MGWECMIGLTRWYIGVIPIRSARPSGLNRFSGVSISVPAVDCFVSFNLIAIIIDYHWNVMQSFSQLNPITQILWYRKWGVESQLYYLLIVYSFFSPMFFFLFVIFFSIHGPYVNVYSLRPVLDQAVKMSWCLTTRRVVLLTVDDLFPGWVISNFYHHCISL